MTKSSAPRHPNAVSGAARLSPRLQLVFDLLLPENDVWDFCCDHGYLGGAAYQSEKFKDIFFVDPVPSIMKRLEERFHQFVFDPENKSTAYFMLRTGQSVSQKVEGTASIIGVGAHVIREILRGLKDNGQLRAQRLILGAQRDVAQLRASFGRDPLFENYALVEKADVIENGRERVFFVLDQVAEN